MLLDSALDKIPLIRRCRQSTGTIWAVASLFLFIDTFIYSLTVANLPDILQDQMHVSKSSNGVVTAMFGIGGLLGGLIAGFLSDRLHTRRSLQLMAGVTYIAAGIVFYCSRHYYQLLIFRLINGVASGVACTMLYTTVGDVYPADLLGFKVSIVYFANNIAYTTGPIVGQKLFDLNGIHGTASIVIAFGALEIFLLLTVVEESLTLRRMVRSHGAAAAISASSSSSAEFAPPSIVKSPQLSEMGADSTKAVSEETVSSEAKGTGHATPSDDEGDLPIWKLIMRLPVFVSTISIVVSIGIQCTLEGMVPLHLDDKFHRSDNSGITFVIFGLALTLFVPCVGSANDWLIGRWGEQMRYYVMLFGSLSTIFSILVMALAGSYAVMMVGYVLFAFTQLCMFIPGQSAYGDFVNYSKVDSMAQSYAISTLSWATGAIALPPIGSALYAGAGFATPLASITAVACIVCAAACLIYPAREALRRRQV